jgi:hypothetical protein
LCGGIVDETLLAVRDQWKELETVVVRKEWVFNGVIEK